MAFFYCSFVLLTIKRCSFSTHSRIRATWTLLYARTHTHRMHKHKRKYKQNRTTTTTALVRSTAIQIWWNANIIDPLGKWQMHGTCIGTSQYSKPSNLSQKKRNAVWKNKQHFIGFSQKSTIDLNWFFSRVIVIIIIVKGTDETRCTIGLSHRHYVHYSFTFSAYLVLFVCLSLPLSIRSVE